MELINDVCSHIHGGSKEPTCKIIIHFFIYLLAVYNSSCTTSIYHDSLYVCVCVCMYLNICLMHINFYVALFYLFMYYVTMFYTVVRGKFFVASNHNFPSQPLAISYLEGFDMY